MSRAARVPVGTAAQELSRLVSKVPHTLQSLASGRPSGLVTSAQALNPAQAGLGLTLGPVGDDLSFSSGLPFFSSGVLYIVGPLTSWTGSGGGPSSCGSSSGGGPGSSGSSPAGTKTSGSGVVPGWWRGCGRGGPVHG